MKNFLLSLGWTFTIFLCFGGVVGICIAVQKSNTREGVPPVDLLLSFAAIGLGLLIGRFTNKKEDL